MRSEDPDIKPASNGKATTKEIDADQTPKRKFKGIWICAAILDDLRLTPIEKFLVAEVDSLAGKDEDTGEIHACFAGRNHFAFRLHVSPAHARDMLAKLTTLGYIIRLFFTGRKTLRCVAPHLSSDPESSNYLIKKYKGSDKADSRCRIKPTAEIGQRRQQQSDKADTEILSIDPNKDTKNTTTTSASRSPVKRKVSRGSRESSSLPCVAGGEEERGTESLTPEKKESLSHEDSAGSPVPSAPGEEEAGQCDGPNAQRSPATTTVSADLAPADLADACVRKYRLSISQGAEVETWATDCPDYVVEKARITDAKSRTNAGGFFMKALRDNYQEPVSTRTETVKPKRTQSAELVHDYVPATPERMADDDAARADGAARLKALRLGLAGRSDPEDAPPRKWASVSLSHEAVSA